MHTQSLEPVYSYTVSQSAFFSLAETYTFFLTKLIILKCFSVKQVLIYAP